MMPALQVDPVPYSADFQPIESISDYMRILDAKNPPIIRGADYYYGGKTENPIPIHVPEPVEQNVTSKNLDLTASTPLKGEFMLSLQKASSYTYTESDWIKQAKSRLEALVRLQKNWDGFDSEPPSKAALESAFKFLNSMHVAGIHPTKIHASSSNGVEVVVRNGKRYFSAEFLNSGSAIYEIRFPGVERLDNIPLTEVEIQRLLQQIKSNVSN